MDGGWVTAAADDFGREIIDTETVAAVISSQCPWYHGLLKLCVCPDFLSNGVDLSTAKSAFGGPFANLLAAAAI
jgi:hypothetical protein